MEKNRWRYFFVVFFLQLFFCFSVYGQQSRYLVYFTDKANNTFSVDHPQDFLSEKALERRQSQDIAVNEDDLPVTAAYVDSLKAMGAQVWYTTRWLNGAIIALDTQMVDEVHEFAFVSDIENLLQEDYNIDSNNTQQFLNKPEKPVECNENKNIYGESYTQNSMICVDDMHDLGYHGEDVFIAVLDAGFRDANETPFFKHLYDNGRVKGTYDVVSRDSMVYDDHSHGTGILSVLAAYDEERIIGPAYNADYFLFRTEKVAYEYRIEEVNWLIAAEKADSMGVDIINSSLGYSTFDNPAHTFDKPELDGQTTIVTKAATHATRRGMVCVMSAGNEGQNDWATITAPADADTVLSVGAVDANAEHASFSSPGPTADGRIKPDVMAMGAGALHGSPGGNTSTGNGSSYASPLIAGLAAGFWQAYPELKNYEVIDLIKSSGSNAEKPDNQIGYGIPCFTRAKNIKEGKPANPENSHFKNPLTDRNFVRFIKKLKSCNQLNIYVYDAAGQRVLTDFLPKPSLEHDLSVETGKLQPGIYFIHVISTDFSLKVKAIKQ